LFYKVGNSGAVQLKWAEEVSLNRFQKQTQGKHINYQHTFTRRGPFACRKPNNKKPFNKYNVIKFQNYTRYYNWTNTITI